MNGRDGIAVGETIVGRARAGGQALVLTHARCLYVIEPARGTFRRVQLTGLAEREEPWGLAALSDGSLWTLLDRDTAGELSPAGGLRRRLRLRAPSFGIFGVGHTLILQPVDLDPPSPALVAGRPDRPERQAWGPLLTRSFARPRGQVIALNLVACTPGAQDVMACWFLSGGDVALVQPDGTGRLVRLQGVRVPTPDALLTQGRAVRGIRDVYPVEGDSLWVLGSDLLTADLQQPQVWQLVRFSPEGGVLRMVTLEGPARFILDIRDDRASLLTVDGKVASVAL